MAQLTPGLMLVAALIAVVLVFALGATLHQVYLLWRVHRTEDNRDYTRSGDWTTIDR